MSSVKSEKSADGVAVRHRRTIEGLGSDDVLLQKKAEDQLLLEKSKLADKP